MDIKDIVQFHGHITGEINLAVTQQLMADNQIMSNKMDRMLEILEELPVKFSKPDDVEATPIDCFGITRPGPRVT